MRRWTYDSLPSSTMSLLDQPAHRTQYQHPQYFMQHSSSLPLNQGHAPYSPHLLWQSATQAMGTDFADSPLGTPYSETGSSDGTFYLPDAASHSVAYPESSQRTHLPEGAAFAAMYHGDFNQELAAIAASPTSRMNPAPSYRQNIPSTRERQPRSSISSDTYPLDSPSATDRMSPQRLMGYPGIRSAANTQGAMQSISSSLAHSTPTSPRSHPDFHAQAIPMHTSPFDSHSRSAAMHRLGEPGSPSVVPPLVFDGETGEEYEDESEYGSADLSRHQSLRQSAQYGTSQAQATEEWANASFDHHRAFGDSGSPHNQHSHFDSQSPTHGPDLELSPQLGSDEGGKAQKKSKMHQCAVCGKWFPRPSGLVTHMNSHTGARPYKCPITSCTKSFAVRSNAKRHLRTHGIFPSTEHPTAPAQFQVGFDAPIVSDVPQLGKLPAKLRWVPQSLATRTNVDYLRNDGSDSDEEYPPSVPVLSVPLPAVVPSSPKWHGDEHYEERNSFDRVGTSPYLSSQWRALPGPAIVTPPSL